jgi:hypothetical protein
VLADRGKLGALAFVCLVVVDSVLMSNESLPAAAG